MEFFDSHTHVDEFEAFGWFDPPEVIINLMDEAGIAKAVIMTYADAPCLKDDATYYIADCIKKFPNRLIGYARIHPQYKQKAIDLFVEAMTDLGFKGLKFHPESITTHPYHGASIALIKKAGEFNAPTLFHSGDECMSLPLQIAKAAELCPDSIIILAHTGGYGHTEDAIRAAEKYENVYIDTSAMPFPAKIKEAVLRIGAERVLFGSDGPGCNPKLEIKKVQLADLTDNEFKMVMSENIQGILERVKVK